MAFGLASGYGMFAALAGRFLYPYRSQPPEWLFVAEASSLRPGQSIAFRSPNGQTISVTRLTDNGTVEDFVALSSVCPHLGCRVSWEIQNNRFFCPCHNGAFDATGNPTAGPPADAGQKLAQYPLKIENGLLFIQVAVDGLA